MLRMAILGAILMCSTVPGAHSSRTQAYQINPKPCWVDGQEGTCMFVYECIKSEGYHIGMCVDAFMFGSCCAHNVTANSVAPAQQHHHQHQQQQQQNGQPAILYTPPSHISHSKPITTIISQTTRPRPSSDRPQPSQATKWRPPNGAAAASASGRPTRKPTQPPRHTDALSAPNSVVAAHAYTKPGWQPTTEPAFITSNNNNNNNNHNNSNHQSGDRTNTWHAEAASATTTEMAYVMSTRQKLKPSNQYSKPRPTKKPIPSAGNKVTTKRKPTTTKATTRRPTTITTTSVSTTARTTSPNAVSETQTTAMQDKNSNAVSQSSQLPQTSTIASLLPVLARAECGVARMTSQPQSKIVGGKNAPFGRWPWQVSVRRTSFFGFSSTHRCGGALLNENWIATAGHCVDDLLTSQIRIRVGEYDFSNVQEELPYVERSVARKVVHPKYNFFTYEYDLALVQLDKPVEFAVHIGPICLPASDDLLIGENATVTGWGRLSEGGTLPSVLQEVQVPIVSNDRCKSMFLRAGRHEHIPDIFLCAGHETGGRDSCQGDSGGPLQVRGKDGRYFLAGIISWGIGCAEANLPGVCTRISKFVPWILNNVT